MNATTQRYAAFAPTDPALRAYVNPVGYYPPSDPVAGDVVAGAVCTFVGSLDDAEAVVAKDNALRQPITIADVLYASRPAGERRMNAPKSATVRTNASIARRLTTGARLLPRGVLRVEAAAALDSLLASGYALTQTGVIARALAEAAETRAL